MPGAWRPRAIPESPVWVPGPHRGVHPAGAAAFGGCESPLPRLSAQCLSSPWGSYALSSEPDGFRNRVAAVSALGQPHLCRPALDSPNARGASPGSPHWRAPGERTLPAAAGRLDAAEQKVRLWSWVPGRQSSLPGQAETHRMLGVGRNGRVSRAAAVWGRWEKGCVLSLTVPIHFWWVRRPRTLESGREKEIAVMGEV